MTSSLSHPPVATDPELPAVDTRESPAHAWRMTRAEFDPRRLPDDRLGGIYRDWVAAHDRRESAYPSEARLCRYAGIARRLLSGDTPLALQSPETFARFVRVRLAAGALGMALASEPAAFHNGRDFPDVHRLLVARALAEGEAVPERVLADYPDLREGG